MNNKIKVAIAGVTGYTGIVLLNLLLKHPHVQIVALCSGQHKGKHLSVLQPSFTGVDGLPNLIGTEELPWDEIDCLFTATPNGYASEIVNKALEHKVKLIDLAADFRLQDANQYNDWYAPLKASPNEVLKQAVYGLVEFNRKEISEAQIIANPGCYPTASALAILPLLKANLIDTSLCIIDAKSGATGAGKKAEEGLLFSEISESFSAYKVDKHRHTPEIEQSLQIFGRQKMNVRFTPHLVPMRRGILATVYLKPKSNNLSEKELQNCFKESYNHEHFVHFVSEQPKTKDVYESNRCHLWAGLDKRTNLIVVVSVIDNLMKGAAGQAVQNFNLMLGLNELLSLG